MRDGYDAFTRRATPSMRSGAEAAAVHLSSGNSLEPSKAFESFRGRGPTVEPMLRKRGLLEPAAN